LTDVALSGSSFHAVYDAENRQVSALVTIGQANTTVKYIYDGDGKRVQQSVQGGATTTFVYDAQGNLAAEYGAGTSSAGTQYLTADHLGSARLATTIGIVNNLRRSRK
jgi:YD repeat-containing protein